MKYYGSFRKDRETSFRKYLKGKVTVSTHQKNREKFNSIGVNGPFIDRINWSKDGIGNFQTSLYIEDEINHDNYNCLANRFYEALNYNVLTLFDYDCKNTIALSGYDIPTYCMVGSEEELVAKTQFLSPEMRDYCFNSWKQQAAKESKDSLTNILSVLS